MLYTLEIKLDTGEQYLWEGLALSVALKLVVDFGNHVKEAYINRGAV
jgi:hypothetical protein